MNYELEILGIENLKLKWIVIVIEDIEGDVGIWNGLFVFNGFLVFILYCYLFLEILDVLFFENVIVYSIEVVMIGVKNNVELVFVYFYYGNKLCDDIFLCNYSFNKMLVVFVCYDLNV